MPGSTAGGTSGLSCNDLSYSIWPRLARPDSLVGERQTTSGILSMQWAPSEKLSVYFDSLYSEADHVYERNDLNLAVRSINSNIPVDVELERRQGRSQRHHRQSHVAEREPPISTKTRNS